MSKRIYVGNLPFSASDDELKELFGQYGEVSSVSIPFDPATKRPQGFGFVEMGDKPALLAITNLNGYQLQEQILEVREA